MPHEQRWWDRSLARFVLFWSTLNIVQSENEKLLLQSLLPPARITVISIPLFDMFTKGQISKADARLQLGIPLDTPVLLFFGIVRKYKGLKDLLSAIPMI